MVLCPSSTAQPYQSLLQVDQFQAHSISASVYTPPLKSSIEFGQAYMALNDIDAAVESFKKALELEPNDAGIKKELAAAKKKISDRRDLERKAYSKMFQ